MTGRNEQQAESNEELSQSVIMQKERNSYKRNTEPKVKELSAERPITNTEVSHQSGFLKDQEEEMLFGHLLRDDESDTSIHKLEGQSAYQTSQGTNLYKRSLSKLTSTSVTRA